MDGSVRRRRVLIGRYVVTAIVVTIVSGFAIGSCGGDGESHHGTSDLPRPESPATVPGGPENPGTLPAGDFLTTPGAAPRAINAIVRELGPRRVRYVNMYDTYVIFEAQDPLKPENIDRYTFRNGRLEPFEPVNVSGQTQADIEADLFTITEVNWAAISDLSRTLLTETDLEGGDVALASVERNVPYQPEVRIGLFMNGTRRNASLDATADGTVLGVRVT
jgi:hypothetical protein